MFGFRSGRSILRIPIATTLVLIAGFGSLWRYQVHVETIYQIDRIVAEANRVDLEISETLQQTSHALQRYTSRIEFLGTGNEAYLDLDSEAYLQQLPILKRIGLVDVNFRVFWSYPHSLAAQVQGFDQRSEGVRRAAFLRARETRQPALSDAIELKSGGTGFLMPIAMFPKGKFGGFVYATIEADRLFHGFVPSADFRVVIVEEARPIFSSDVAGPLAEEFVQTKRLEGNSKWLVQVTPTEHFVRGGRALPAAILFGLGVAVSLLFGAFLASIFRSRQLAVTNSEWRKTLINASEYGIISTDANGMIRSFNPAAAAMLQYDPAEVIDRMTPRSFHLDAEVLERAQVLSKELGREVRPGFDSFTAKAAELRAADENEWTFVRKDQSRFPANLSVTAFYNADGSVEGYLGTFQDLSERKKANQQITVTSERLTRIIEATEEGIWEREYLPDGKIRYMDAQAKKVFGFHADAEVDYEQIASLVVPEDFAKAAVAIRAHVEQKTFGFDVEFQIQQWDAKLERRWVRARGQVLRRNEGPDLLVSTMKDVTAEVHDRKRLKAALAAAEEATRAKSDFLANMSHEIRTPLNGVLGMAGLLLDAEIGSTERAYVETIRSSGEILLSLINDILDFSKIEARKLDLEVIPFDIDSVSENIHRLLGFSATKKGLSIRREIDPAVLARSYRGDPNRIGQILANLLGNAIKFTERGQIDVTITKELSPGQSAEDGASILRVEVTDTGIGLSAEAVARMFQPFTQADVSTSRRFGGTGLGLSICKHLVEMMNGQIGVRSRENQGSTFWFTLRLETVEHANRHFSASPAAPRTPAEGPKIRVLLAEDNPVNQLIGRKMLEKSGYRVDVVANGREAIDALTTAPYDLVLMDCQMPEMDGYEATGQIREHSNTLIRQIPIVAMTANAMSGDREKCLDAGMNDYVTKPIRIEEMISAIQRVLQLESGAEVLATKVA